MDDLKFNKPSLDSEDQQRDAFSHPPAGTEHELAKDRCYSQTLTGSHACTCRHGFRPVHGVVIHEGSVTLKIELAKCKNSQSDEGDGENKAQQGVWRTTTFCNTVGKNQKANKHRFSWLPFQ